MVTPAMFIYPKALAKVGMVPGGPQMNKQMQTTTGDP